MSVSARIDWMCVDKSLAIVNSFVLFCFVVAKCFRNESNEYGSRWKLEGGDLEMQLVKTDLYVVRSFCMYLLLSTRRHTSLTLSLSLERVSLLFFARGVVF